MHDPTKPYTVYIRTDEHGRVTGINSDAFLEDTEGWQPIDSGFGDRYRHAQGNYLPGPLTDADGICRYREEGGAVAERTAAELEADREAAAALLPIPDSQRIASLEQQIDMLLRRVTSDEPME